MTMTQLLCTDAHGQRNQFYYTMAAAGGEWCFRVRPEGAPSDSDFFELTVEEVDDQNVRVIMMNNNRFAPVKAKGIPDALIPKIRQVLGRGVQSSPKQGSSFDVRREPAADKVWQRLVAANLARYDQAADVFYLL